MTTGVTYEEVSGCAGCSGVVGTPSPKREVLPVNTLQELRIGDYIIFNNKLLRVDLEFFNLLFQLEDDEVNQKLNGLEITEELLLTLNYYKQKNYEYDHINEIEYETNPYYFNKQVEVWRKYSSPRLYYKGDKFLILGGSYPQIKYLHQLQNFFVCKAGEELIIDDDKLKEYYEKN